MKSVRIGILTATLVAILLACGANAFAQRFESTGIKGVYVGLGLGTGSTHSGYHERYYGDKRSSGLASNLCFGFIIQKGVLLGFELSDFRFESQGEDWDLSSGAIVVTYYPHKSFFIRGGPAVGSIDYRYKIIANSFEYTTISDYGAGIVLAAGADVSLSKHYSFLPTVRYLIADFDEFSANGVALTFEFARFW
jgi:hypothetical protein